MKLLPHPGKQWGGGRRIGSISPMILVPLITLVLFMVLFTLYFSPFKQFSKAHASGTTQLPGHVPAIVARSQTLEPTDGSKVLTLTVGLHLRNQTSLENYVHALDTKQAQQTHMTLDQIIMAYGPLPSAQQAVINYMQQAGFTLTATYKHHLLVTFSGTVATAENAFAIQINNYRSPDGTTYFAPATNPSVPSSLSSYIQSINGLDNAAHYSHPPIVSIKNAHAQLQANTVGCPANSTTPATYYTPSQLANIYNLEGLHSHGFYGDGQSVALFELDDYVPGDIAAYTSCYNGYTVPISRILVDGGAVAHPSSGALEVELDMDLVLSTAPHIANLRVYEAPNSNSGILAEWSQIITDAVPVVSTSWGACEPLVTKAFAQLENSLFVVAAAQGQSILAASGDHETNDCQGQVAGVKESVDDPASQPFVTGVGGTSLSSLVSANPMEQYWQNGTSTGGGGGISTFWAQPVGQQAPGVVNSYSSGTPCGISSGICREVPDVSLSADPNTGYPIYCTVTSANCSSSTPWVAVGGTSAAAPMWAAMIALANEKSLHDGNFNLGYLNPLLYTVAQNASEYANDFHDITVGNSSSFGDGKYPTTTGYDMTTGLGSYNALSLTNDLETVAANQKKPRAANASTTWYFAEGSVGNSFQEYLTFLNPNTTQTATVTTTYLFENKPSTSVTHLVSPNSRQTVSVNQDLQVQTTDPQVAVATIVKSNVAIVAERPMYFDLHGVHSGTDVLGATNANQTTFYFAEGDTRQDATRTYSTYVTLLNPSTTQTAHVKINYYNNGLLGTQTINVAPLQRGTGTPVALGIYKQVAIQVVSDIGIVAERPMYFSDDIVTAGGRTTGAASATGATSLGSDWLFAEGYTGTDFQEYIVLANFTTTPVKANVKLEYTNGNNQTVSVTVSAESQYYFDVNNSYIHPQAGAQPTASVSAEVTASSPSIIAERLMYFHFSSSLLSGGTDVVGQAGPASHAVYSFAEGYTYTGFSEFLTLQNPTTNPVNVAITLFADGTILQETKLLSPLSRTTVSINSLIVPLASAYPTTPPGQGYEVSMNVQALNGSIVAERPLYFNLHGAIGGSDVIGYTGG